MTTYGGDTWTRTKVPIKGADLQSAAVAAVPYPHYMVGTEGVEPSPLKGLDP